MALPQTEDFDRSHRAPQKLRARRSYEPAEFTMETEKKHRCFPAAALAEIRFDSAFEIRQADLHGSRIRNSLR
jgi:hypothetical protein